MFPSIGSLFYAQFKKEKTNFETNYNHNDSSIFYLQYLIYRTYSNVLPDPDWATFQAYLVLKNYDWYFAPIQSWHTTFKIGIKFI